MPKIYELLTEEQYEIFNAMVVNQTTDLTVVSNKLEKSYALVKNLAVTSLLVLDADRYEEVVFLLFEETRQEYEQSIAEMAVITAQTEQTTEVYKSLNDLLVTDLIMYKNMLQDLKEGASVELIPELGIEPSARKKVLNG